MRLPLPLFTSALLLASAPAQGRTWTDTEMLTWSCSTIAAVGASSATCAQISAGGNPGAGYRVQHVVGSQGSITMAHLPADPLALFDPVTEGPFGRLVVSFDVDVQTGAQFGGVVAFGVELEQGGTRYSAGCTYDLVFIHEGWVRLSWEVTEDQLSAGGTTPDLRTGAPFRVGLRSGNSTCCGGGSATFTIDNFEVTAVVGQGPLGTTYCGGPVNSSGQSGRIFADGSDLAGGQPLRLRAMCLPDDAFGYFLASTTQGSVPNAGGGAGTLCLGGSVGRFDALVQSSGHGGWFAIDVDTLAIPQPTGAVAIQPGETWSFQCWHRDVGSTSNFTDAVEVVFN